MPTDAYQDALKRARRLTHSDQLRLLEKSAGILRQREATQRRRSILELQGLGKEVWRGVDPRGHVDRERNFWNR
jgi:hypothetical protein